MSNERKFRLQVTEEELIALIAHHSMKLASVSGTALWKSGDSPQTEVSERLHDLVKRLNKTGPEAENETKAQSDGPQENKSEGAEAKPDTTGW